jgi:hypothetical protein
MRNHHPVESWPAGRHHRPRRSGGDPRQTGWSGFLLGGVNAGSHKSNFYAGDDSNSRIDDLGSPGRESGLSPLLNADIRYTFADTRTQVFLGNLIQDAVRFDFTQQLGLRQEMGDKGIVATSLVFNLMPVELWSDPFATGVDRSATDLTSKGVRFAWDKIWGSNVYATLTSREVELDEERSGQQYDLTHGTHYASMLEPQRQGPRPGCLLPVPLRRQPAAGARLPLQGGPPGRECGELQEHRSAADLCQARLPVVHREQPLRRQAQV